jgi:hypothetical protein
MVRTSVECGLLAIDASRGSLNGENIMRDWTREAIDHEDLWIFGTTAAARLSHFAQTRVRPIVRSLRGAAGGR